MTKVFVEIGSCDFDNLDCLLDEGWAGYFIEPIPESINSLINKVRRPNRMAQFHNIAISDRDGTMDMVYIDPKTASEEWVRGISHSAKGGSNLIYLNERLGHQIGNKKTITVPCLTLDTYLQRHGITRIDMLRVDVEGHEIDVLQNYSWTIKPKYIKIEHKFVDLNKLWGIITKQGYEIMNHQDDLYCVLK